MKKNMKKNMKKRLAVIDKDRGFLECCREIFSYCDYEVIVAMDLSDLKPQVSDLAMLLFHVGRLQELNEISMIKRTYPKTKIVAISAATKTEMAPKARLAGADYFLTKPFDFNELLEILQAS